MILRDYQVEAVDDVLRLWREGHRGVLLHLATGLGKTVVMADLAAQCRREGERILVLAHLGELLDNCSARFKDFYQGDEHLFERNLEYVSSAAIHRGAPSVVFGMVQSIHKRLEKYPRDYFSKIFIDETHRSLAVTYRKVLDYFTEAQLLGVTATPKRADKLALGAVFDVASECSMSVTEGIGLGWLVPFRPASCHVESLDFSDCHQKGDITDEQIVAALEKDGRKPLHEIAAGLKKWADGLQSIVFLAGVESARELARILRHDYLEAVDFIHGGTEQEDRKRILDDYRSGKILRIINVGVLTEGVDLPNTQCVAIARVTRSEGRYLQMAGRGTRPYPGGLVDMYATPHERVHAIGASVKPECLLLDFKGNMGRVRPCIDGRDLLAGIMPHRDYGGQPVPSAAKVIEVGDREDNLGRSIEDLRQLASDELFVAELLADSEDRLYGKVKKAQYQEHKDLFGAAWTPEPGPAIKEKVVMLKDKALPDQRARLDDLHDLLGIPRLSSQKMQQLTRKQARFFIGRLLQQLPGSH